MPKPTSTRLALEDILTTIIHEQVDTMIQQAHATTAPTPLHPALADDIAPEAQSSDEPRNLFLMEEEEFVMPDTPLRGMIRETLVQELQGEFGDQFSRKLRNLVRAEIAMALKEAIKGYIETYGLEDALSRLASPSLRTIDVELAELASG